MTKKIGLYRDTSRKPVQWRVRWFGEYDPNTERPKRYSKTFTRKKDAEDFQTQKESEFRKGTLRDSTNETLKGYADRWLLEKIKIEGLRPGTVQLYEVTLRRLYNHFGPDMLLHKIDRRAAKTFLAGLVPMGDKKTLGNWSRHRVLRHCITLFGEAVADGAISNNPFKKLKKPKCTLPKWYFLQPDEFHKLLDVTLKLREKVLYALAYTAGLRETEALTLYWTNIDFDKGRVHIEDRDATGEYPPFKAKTEGSGDRIVPLPKLTLDLLAQLQLEAPGNVPFVLMDERGCKRIRDKWQECQRQGRQWLNRYWSNNVVRNFHRRVQWAGIEPDKELTVHVLRKCCSQQWQNTLPMNVVKEFMGHSKGGVTEKFYSTVNDGHYRIAQEAMDEWLGKAGAEKTDHKLTFSGNLMVNSDNRQQRRCG